MSTNINEQFSDDNDAIVLQGVFTRWLGPTNNRGSRIKAVTGSGHTLTVPWDYSQGTSENHRSAAIALVQRLGWQYEELVTGTIPQGYAHTLLVRTKEPEL
jgi:hypothetical protein